MSYTIKGLCHRTDIDMGAHGFSIDLDKSFAEAVFNSGLTQNKIDRQVETMGEEWLAAAGFAGTFDPDNCGAFRDKAAPPGPRSRPLYVPSLSIRVAWGAWGPEHISVPGDACGLDIDRDSFGCVYKGGASLHPHNVDGLAQKYLLLIVFTEIAYNIALFSRTPGPVPLETAEETTAL